MKTKKTRKICTTCGDPIDESEDHEPYWLAWDKEKQKNLYFCTTECCARWYAEEIEYEFENNEDE